MLKTHFFNQSLVAYPRAFFIAIFVIALLLTIPALTTGIYLDDYYHRMVMLDLLPSEHLSKDASLFGLFSFLDGDAKRTLLLIEQGVLPWWALPEVKYTFFRPLSELSIYLDYTLWPDSFFLMHLHSNVIFALLAVFCSVFFSLITQDKRIVLLASLFFVLDATHGLSIAWLAARNALLAAMFGMISMVFVVLYYKKNKSFYLYLSMFFMLFSFAAGEIGLSSCAFIVAYILFQTESDLKKKASRMLPFLSLALGWLFLRNYLGFGAYGTGAYQDPFQDTFSFIVNFSEKINLIYFGLWSGIPVELLSHRIGSDAFSSIFIFFGLNIFFLVLYGPFWIKNRRAWFYLSAMFLASVPVSAGEIQSRVLVFVSIPALAFCAECLLAFWDSRKTLVNGEGVTKVALYIWVFALYFFSILCLLAHLLVAPLLLLKSQTLLAEIVEPNLHEPVMEFQVSEALNEKILILLNPPLATIAGYFPIMRTVAGKENAKKTFILGSGLHGMNIKRVDESSFELQPERGFLFEPMDRVMRSNRFLFQVGDVVSLSEFEVTIISLNDSGYPKQVLFRFSEALESQRYDFRCWQATHSSGRFEPCVFPSRGETLFK